MDIKVNYVQKLNREENSKLLGFASITVDNLFTINNIAILVGQDRSRFISMPTYKGKDDEFHDLVSFSEYGYGVREDIKKAIINAYDKSTAERSSVSEELNKEEAIKNVEKVGVFVKENKYVSLSYNEMYFNGCKLNESEKGIFLSNPSRKYEKDGETKYRDVFYVPCAEARNFIQEKAKTNYEQSFNKENTQTSHVEENAIDHQEDEEDEEETL